MNFPRRICRRNVCEKLKQKLCHLTCDADVKMGVFVYQNGSQVEETGVRVRLVETDHLFDQGLEERGWLEAQAANGESDGPDWSLDDPGVSDEGGAHGR